jgi:hypothetical protein
MSWLEVYKYLLIRDLKRPQSRSLCNLKDNFEIGSAYMVDHVITITINDARLDFGCVC